MLRLRTGPLIGLIAQIVLFAALAGTVGLGPAAWVVGLLYGVGTCVVLTHGMRVTGTPRLGPADWVTLTRATLVGGVLAVTVESLQRPTPVAVLVALTAVALALDAVDGQVARHTGTASPLGARFDMEVDAFLLLVLGVYLTDSLGGWVLAIGALRYAFVAASWLLPWMRRSLPPRYWRKAVAALQGIVLLFAAAGVGPRPLVIAVVGLGLILLLESFARDIRWLWRHRPMIGAETRAVTGFVISVETDVETSAATSLLIRAETGTVTGVARLDEQLDRLTQPSPAAIR